MFYFYFSTLLHHTYLLNIGVHIKLSIYILQPYIKIHLKHIFHFSYLLIFGVNFLFDADHTTLCDVTYVMSCDFSYILPKQCISTPNFTIAFSRQT